MTSIERRIVTRVTRQESIRILWSPIVVHMPRGHLIIRTIVLPPERRGFIRRIPILLTHPLEESTYPDIVPIGRERKTINITRFLVTNDLTVARIIYRILSAVNIAVAIQVFELNIARIQLIGFRCLHKWVIIGLPRSFRSGLSRIDASLILPQAIGYKPPNLTDTHSLVIILVERLICVLAQ